MSPELYSEQACAGSSSQRERKSFCFPPTGPQNVRKARYLCGWILGSLLVKSSNFLIQQMRQGNCPPTLGGSCQNNHTGDNVSPLYISLWCFSLLISHLSRSGISWAVCASSNTGSIISDTKHSGWDEWEYIIGHLKTWTIIIMVASGLVLHSGTMSIYISLSQMFKSHNFLIIASHFLMRIAVLINILGKIDRVITFAFAVLLKT